MRFVIIGAGAVGGVVGGYLARSGQPVTLVARGEHGARILADGLQVATPGGRFTVRVPVVDAVADLTLDPGDVILLAVKGQDTRGVIDALAATGAPSDVPIVCLQNGVANEAVAAERFDRVYGVPVQAPTSFLEPGVVEAMAGPVPAILDIGRYPEGVDATAETLAATFVSAGMVSEARPDIMRWKWAKLLVNLGNAVEVVCGPAARSGPLGSAAVREGARVLNAAGIAHASAEEERSRRGDILRWTPTAEHGGSSWQSAMRRVPLETDLLTGEIVRLGARVGEPTPVNSALLHRALAIGAARSGPGQVPPEVILAEAGLA